MKKILIGSAILVIGLLVLREFIIKSGEIDWSAFFSIPCEECGKPMKPSSDGGFLQCNNCGATVSLDITMH